jgi:predicted transcriptional regulator
VVKKKILANLSRRERQIMDIIFENGEATGYDVQEGLPDPPSYSTVRALLRILEEKGYLKHKKRGAQYVFSPAITRKKARDSALKHVMQTFFDNSVESTVAALMGFSGSKLTDDELDRLAELVEQARKKGRK